MSSLLIFSHFTHPPLIFLSFVTVFKIPFTNGMKLYAIFSYLIQAHLFSHSSSPIHVSSPQYFQSFGPLTLSFSRTLLSFMKGSVLIILLMLSLIKVCFVIAHYFFKQISFYPPVRQFSFCTTPPPLQTRIAFLNDSMIFHKIWTPFDWFIDRSR